MGAEDEKHSPNPDDHGSTPIDPEVARIILSSVQEIIKSPELQVIITKLLDRFPSHTRGVSVEGLTQQEMGIALHQVEVAFMGVLMDRKIGKEEEIPVIRSEYYHQDEPDVTISWSRNDGISRNIHAFLVSSEAGVQTQVEVNAWRDDTRPDGSGTRHSRHQPVAMFVGTPNLDTLTPELDRAYRTVQSWQHENLTRQTVLSSRPS